MRIANARAESLRIRAIKWAADAADAAIKWHTTNTPTLTPQQIEAFDAGFRQGFREGVNAVILQEDL